MAPVSASSSASRSATCGFRAMSPGRLAARSARSASAALAVSLTVISGGGTGGGTAARSRESCIAQDSSGSGPGSRWVQPPPGPLDVGQNLTAPWLTIQRRGLRTHGIDERIDGSGQPVSGGLCCGAVEGVLLHDPRRGSRRVVDDLRALARLVGANHLGHGYGLG